MILYCWYVDRLSRLLPFPDMMASFGQRSITDRAIWQIDASARISAEGNLKCRAMSHLFVGLPISISMVMFWLRSLLSLSLSADSVT